MNKVIRTPKRKIHKRISVAEVNNPSQLISLQVMNCFFVNFCYFVTDVKICSQYLFRLPVKKTCGHLLWLFMNFCLVCGSLQFLLSLTFFKINDLKYAYFQFKNNNNNFIKLIK